MSDRVNWETICLTLITNLEINCCLMNSSPHAQETEIGTADNDLPASYSRSRLLKHSRDVFSYFSCNKWYVSFDRDQCLHLKVESL
jgi:hypothetical protein